VLNVICWFSNQIEKKKNSILKMDIGQTSKLKKKIDPSSQFFKKDCQILSFLGDLFNLGIFIGSIISNLLQ